MKELIAFISQYEPVYQEVVRGATEERVAALEAALGRRLPGAYRDFLTSAGANIGFATGDANFDVEQVIEFVTDRDEPIPERLIPIAEDEGPSFCDYYLDLSQPSGQDDAMVVRVPSGDILREPSPIFYSLRDMLFGWAFNKIRIMRLPEQTELLWLPSDFLDPEIQPSLAALRKIMTNLGFEALQVTSEIAQLYEREDFAASVYQVPFEQPFSLKLAATDRRTMLDVAETVRDSMPRRGSTMTA